MASRRYWWGLDGRQSADQMEKRLQKPRRLSGGDSSAGHMEYGIRTQIAKIEDGDRVLRRKH